MLFFDMTIRVLNIRQMNRNEVRTLRAEAVRRCQTLVRRCGSLDALLGRSDYCEEFFHLCPTVFEFQSADELLLNSDEQQNLEATSGSSFETNLKRSEHVTVQLELLKAAIEEGVQNLWLLSNLALVGKVLYIDMVSRVQDIGQMKPCEAEHLRAEALAHCQSLAGRCGSFDAFLTRTDYCRKFY